MTLRELAHLAQQTLQDPCRTAPSNAAMCTNSWLLRSAIVHGQPFGHSEAVLADAGVGERPSDRWVAPSDRSSGSTGLSTSQAAADHSDESFCSPSSLSTNSRLCLLVCT